ncbi:MAG: hypothetical protein A2Y41_07275 [Spirochaetes bacterium GWB1_36_13]|nr:MAG: hypothetical protein A2Y41_07275 [Spirochaetes bacterium GWB1_36_13]
MNLLNFYEGKVVKTVDMAKLQDNIQEGDRNIVKEILGYGIGQAESFQPSINGLTLTLTAPAYGNGGYAYDGYGRRISLPPNETLTVDFSAYAGQTIKYSVFVRIKRKYETPEENYQGETEYFEEKEYAEAFLSVSSDSNYPFYDIYGTVLLFDGDAVLGSAGFVSNTYNYARRQFLNPKILMNEVYPFTDISDMLSSGNARRGDVGVVADDGEGNSKTYILRTDDYSKIENWVELKMTNADKLDGWHLADIQTGYTMAVSEAFGLLVSQLTDGTLKPHTAVNAQNSYSKSESDLAYHPLNKKIIDVADDGSSARYDNPNDTYLTGFFDTGVAEDGDYFFYQNILSHSGGHVKQIKYSYFANEMYIRGKISGTWGAWKKVTPGTTPVAYLKYNGVCSDPNILLAIEYNGITGLAMNGGTNYDFTLPVGVYKISIHATANSINGSVWMMTYPALTEVFRTPGMINTGSHIISGEGVITVSTQGLYRFALSSSGGNLSDVRVVIEKLD